MREVWSEIKAGIDLGWFLLLTAIYGAIIFAGIFVALS